MNKVATGLFLVLCLGIAVLALRTSRRPRFAQLAFLVIAAFVITNKVYSPQYVLWLIPLAAMARPRWRDFLIWQVGQVIYFAAIWLYLVGYTSENKGLPIGWYSVSIIVAIASTCYFGGMVIRDMIQPEHDPLRTAKFVEDRDDTGGGVLDGETDRGAREAVAAAVDEPTATASA